MSFFPSFANWKRNFQFRDLPSLHSCAAVAGIMAPPHVCCKSQLEGQRSATLRGLPSLASCHPHSFCMLQRMKLWANANEILSRSSSSAFPSPYLKPRRQAGEQCPSSAPLLTEQTNSVLKKSKNENKDLTVRLDWRKVRVGRKTTARNRETGYLV